MEMKYYFNSDADFDIKSVDFVNFLYLARPLVNATLIHSRLTASKRSTYSVSLASPYVNAASLQSIYGHCRRSAHNCSIEQLLGVVGLGLGFG